MVNYPQLLALQPADYDKSIQNRNTTSAIFALFFTYPSEELTAIAFGI